MAELRPGPIAWYRADVRSLLRLMLRASCRGLMATLLDRFLVHVQAMADSPTAAYH